MARLSMVASRLLTVVRVISVDPPTDMVEGISVASRSTDALLILTGRG